MAERRPLIDDGVDLSDTAHNTPALPSLGFTSSSHSLDFHAPPTSPPANRPSYHRLGSESSTAFERTTPPVIEEEGEDIADGARFRDGSGLGIAGAPSAPSGVSRRVSIPRRPVPYSRRSSTIVSPVNSPNVKSPDTLSPPNTGDLLGRFPNQSPTATPNLSRERFSPNDDPGDYEDFRRKIMHSSARRDTSESVNNDYQNYLHSTDTTRLRQGAPSLKSAYENDFRPTQECPTAKDFYTSRYTWVSLSILMICIFSAVFSGIFLGLALKAPRYGRNITSHGNFKPADAIVLTSVMAKLIELSFVTSFVAFLGQVLSRRAFMKEHGRGVTLSELSMWRWIVQPGTLITHPETAKYAGLSVLGILSLVSAVLATLYSSAATALVQPMLKDGYWENSVMVGRVKTTWANVKYVSKICETPIRTDEVYAGSTCLQIEHAGQGYHNYQRYLADWNKAAKHGNGTSDQTRRPPGFGLLYENTTVTAQWINVVNTTEVSQKHGRTINNVSLAMPHSGVFQAARDERNGILQPEELNSEGTYSLRASVPSPVMNVLCANMNEKELAPLIYDTWNPAENVNITTFVSPGLKDNATTTANTVVDDIFGWTKKDNKTMLDYPPVFAKYPKPFNTIMNHTNAFWGRDSIYLLGQGGKDSGSDLTGVYVLCQIHVSLTPDCSTRYNATGSGGTMESLCEDPHDQMAYIKRNTSAPVSIPIQDWQAIGFDWSNSLSLNTGIVDADASNSRLLTQLILQPSNPDPKNLEVDLSPALPSVGEALAVMSGCTLLKSMLDAPYVMFWNYTLPMLDEYQSQYFNASVKAQQYASGGVDEASKGWIIILLLVFLMNIFVLVYFIFHRGLVTDFSEPPNLFALAVNSPPSHLLAGSCGGGPEGKQYMVNWFVNAEGDHLYVEPGEKPVHEHHEHVHGHSHGHAHAHGTPHLHVHPPSVNSGSGVRGVNPETKSGFVSTVTGGFNKLRERGLHFGRKQDVRRLRPASVVASDLELEDANTRTQRQYAKLAKRRSML